MTRPDTARFPWRAPLRAAALAALLGAGLYLAQPLVLPAGAAEQAVRVPAPALDEPRSAQPGSATAVFAGGCFWGVQGVFQHVRGVAQAVSGYAGGSAGTAQYDQVGTGMTGHAESVRVTYDPSQVSYGELLEIFFSVAHDPTQLDRQGPDVGPQYRSAIFPQDAEQDRIARAYIEQLGQAGVYPGRIVTRIEQDKPFYPAEDYHQDYLTRHPDNPYIVINDLPKVRELERLYAQRYRAEPVLVGAAAAM